MDIRRIIFLLLTVSFTFSLPEMCIRDRYKGGQGNWATTSGTFYWPITEMQFFGYTNDVTYTCLLYTSLR